MEDKELIRKIDIALLKKASDALKYILENPKRIAKIKMNNPKYSMDQIVYVLYYEKKRIDENIKKLIYGGEKLEA